MILSLFPGIDMLGHAVELELDACVVRGPDVIYGLLSDIRTFHPPPGVFDGVIGGPPCQSFSALANLVRAKGHEPRFGNLIPEFERCVSEARPRWFLMENVPAAPVPVVDGYAVRDFVICNSWVDGGDGMGEEQERKRRFSFGVDWAGGNGRLLRLAESGEYTPPEAPDLRRWIKPAALLLPKADRVTAVSNSGSRLDHDSDWYRERGRVPCVDAGHQGPSGRPKDAGRSRAPKANRVERERIGTVTGGGQERLPGEQLKRGGRRSLAEMCRLQGVPPNLLDDVPWTMQGKRQAIANGVPMPTGRAVARAVRCALEELETAP